MRKLKYLGPHSEVNVGPHRLAMGGTDYFEDDLALELLTKHPESWKEPTDSDDEDDDK